MRKVGFLCIGAQKGGTTWLNEQLARHPGIYLPPIKEVHYFNYRFSASDREWIPDHYRRSVTVRTRSLLCEKTGAVDIDWRQIAYYSGLIASLDEGRVDDSWYASVYALCPDDQRLLGDITPAYLPLPAVGVEAVRKYNPDLRIIAMLREPVDRAISAARMILKRRHVNSPSESDWKEFISGGIVANKSRYAEQLGNWMSLFPRDQFHIVPYEQIGADPISVLDSVCAFLGVPPLEHSDAEFERVHAGRRYDVPAWVRDALEDKLGKQREKTLAMFPELTPWWSTPQAPATSV